MRTRLKVFHLLCLGVLLASACGNAQDDEFNGFTDPSSGGSGGAQNRGGRASGGRVSGNAGEAMGGDAITAQAGSPGGGNEATAGAAQGGANADAGAGAVVATAGQGTSAGGAPGAAGSGGQGGCDDTIQCDQGYCVDGVCCNEPASTCNGCRACNVDGFVGTCTDVPSGQDPHGACSLNLQGCEADTCNGQGSCEYPDDTPCDDTTCGGDQETRHTCQNGSCTSSQHGCQGLGCNANYCNATCTAGTETGCESNHYCLPTGDACAPQQGDGQDCQDDIECLSGNCVDGVCCSSPADDCNGCFSCKVLDFYGTCMPLPFGTDPHLVCAADACNANACNGQGSCALPDDTSCQDPSCSKGQESSGACSGGLCLVTVSNCWPFLCNATDCYESCTVGTNEGCPADYYCVGGNDCQPLKDLGMSCDSAEECKGGAFCTDGVCCKSDACVPCMACNFGAQPGECGDVPQGEDPKNDCDDTLCTTGNCAYGACETENDLGHCAPMTCSDGTQTEWLCKGGICNDIVTSCENYICADAMSCAEFCTQGTDEGCSPDAYCDATNHCQPKHEQGKSCETDNQCEAGLFCTDNTCCDMPICSETCESCQNDLGTCWFTWAGSDPHDDCADNDFCLSGLCDNSGGCETANEGLTCAPSECAADNQTDYTCYLGTCDPGMFSCGNYVCADSNVCAVTCTQGTDEGCAAGFFCDLNDECNP